MKKTHLHLFLISIIAFLFIACDSDREISSVLTPTVAPTATTVPTVTIAPTATTTPTVTIAPTATTAPTTLPVKTGDITYTFDELSYVTSYVLNYSVNPDGSVSIQYNQRYGELTLAFPETINPDECLGITITLDTDYSQLAFSFQGQEVLANPYCDNLYITYPTFTETQTECGISLPAVNEIYSIGIMELDDVTDFTPYNVTLYSITFLMQSGNIIQIPKDIAPDVTEDMTLLSTYGTVFGKTGTCVSLAELNTPATLSEIKKQYNSVTSSYEAKQDFLLQPPASLIPVEEAKSMGYVIPDNYHESVVPAFDFSVLDDTLRICAENNLNYRFHTLLWHEQTLNWFFRTGYSGAYVSPEVMDARTEFYIRTVMEHIYTGNYGSSVYAWDVTNEYLHSNASNFHWINVYGDEGLTPSFVKHAFEIADDVLQNHGVRDQVSLFYNDYDTYRNTNTRNMPFDIISLIDFINSERKVCDGLGLQAHLNTDVRFTSDLQKALEAFHAKGYELQITELQTIELSLTSVRMSMDSVSWLCMMSRTFPAINPRFTASPSI